jgi:hypothetical protein
MGLLYLLQRPGILVCKTRLFFIRKVRYVGIVYAISNVQQIYIFRIILCILKSDTIFTVCIKHASVLFQPLIMEVWIMIPGQCLWDLWCTKWQWEQFLFRIFQFLLIGMIQQMLHSHSFLFTTVVLVYHTVSSIPG